MAPPSSRANDAFPRGTYAKYKRATTFFLRWLLRARNGGVGADYRANITQPMDSYEHIVHAIAQNPTSLPAALLQAFPHALHACEVAITLRARVAVFFGDSADDGHAHFLGRLKKWFQTLSGVQATSGDGGAAVGAEEAHPCDFSNYYEVLALPDDYFASDEDADAVSTSASLEIPPLSKSDRKRLQHDTFADDFSTELACLFMELDELSEAVYATYLDVRREKKTLVEATVVAKVAIDSAASVIANMQLRYPSLRDGSDLSKLIEDRLSLDQITRLVATVQTAWIPSEDPSEIRYQYVPGTVLVDIVSIARLFGVLAPQMPKRMRTLGERYDEATTRHFVMPEWDRPPAFFLHHLPLLLNLCVDIQDVDSSGSPKSLQLWLLDPFREFSKTGSVSIHLVFSCVCWIRSIAALQGDRSLARATSLSIMHMWHLEQRLGASVIANGGRGQFHEEVAWLHKQTEVLDYVSTHMRVNPLLAGCVLLDQQRHYLAIGNDSLLLSLFRPFCHIYSALRDRRLIDEVPFIEDAIKVYEATVFTPSRAAATHGSFARSFVASHNLIEATVLFRLNRRMPSRQGQVRSVVEKGRISYLSHVIRLLDDNDFSALPPTSSVSWTAFLSKVSNLCHDELHGSRLLSRDPLKFSDDLTDTFVSLCDALNRRDQLNRMVSRSTTRIRALENTVVFTLLPLLDTLSDADLARPESSSLDLCRRAALVISRRFGDAVQVERNYFTFRATPAWVSATFPHLKPDGKVELPTMNEFNALMEILQTSQGPLRGEKLDQFKHRVAATPAVLMMISPVPKAELWSLLHHVAAGPAHDMQLVEWLIQMGALEFEPPYCRNPDILARMAMPAGCSLDLLPNALAIHVAAKRGHKKMVKLMMEAGNFRDLDTKTFHTKESLAQIAVQLDDRDLFGWLLLHGAKCWGIDASGKHIWDFASDRKWKAKLKQVGSTQKSREEQKANEWGYQRSRADMEMATQQARRSIHTAVLANAPVQQPSVDRVDSASRVTASPVLSGLSVSASGVTGKKHKKKRKKGANSKSPASAETTTTHLMEQLFVADDAERREDKIHVLSTTLEQLKTQVFGASEDRETCASSVLAIYEHFASSVQTIGLAGILSTSAAVRKEVQDAGRAMLLLNDFQQHLSAQAHTDKSSDSTFMSTLCRLVTPADDENFHHFFQVMMKSFVLLRRCDVMELGNKILGLMESHLLSIKVRSGVFRKMVREYTMARKVTKQNPVLASTPAAERQLEWYASDHGVQDKEELHRLDRLIGCNHYFRLKTVGGVESHALEPCRVIIDETIPHRRVAVYVAACIIAGAETRQHLSDILKVVLAAAEQTGLVVQYGEKDLDLVCVEIMGFVFSATGIVRKGPETVAALR